MYRETLSRFSCAASPAYDDLKFSCGCREIRHFYHDGSMRVRTIRHDGKVLKDEHSGDHEA
ncbi:hypothetical protein ABLN67_00205 [Mycobacterium tuberculosis]